MPSKPNFAPPVAPVVEGLGSRGLGLGFVKGHKRTNFTEKDQHEGISQSHSEIHIQTLDSALPRTTP